MRWTQLVPAPLVPAARKFRARLRRRPTGVKTDILGRSRVGSDVRSQEELHAFWRDPDPSNRPEDYVLPVERGVFLADLLARHGGPADRVLEIGTNVGRNLEYLRRVGYRDLEGVEISKGAIEAMQIAYPELSALATIHNAPVEEAIRTFADASFDVVSRWRSSSICTEIVSGSSPRWCASAVA